MPANRRIEDESYSASSAPGSERLNHCCRKYTRSIISSSFGGRPSPAFGYTGSINAHSSHHGTMRSISVRNFSRRVVLLYFSKPVPSVICLLIVVLGCIRCVDRGLLQRFLSEKPHSLG